MRIVSDYGADYDRALYDLYAQSDRAVLAARQSAAEGTLSIERCAAVVGEATERLESSLALLRAAYGVTP